jgi:uncharacterized protein (TIGR03437 family)
MTQSGSATWTVEIPVAQVLNGYQAGYGHHFYGYIDIYEGVTRAARANLVVNVLDETMPGVPIRGLSSQAQMTRHVLNLREDTAWFVDSAGVPPAVFARFYAVRNDDFDFLAVVGEGVAFKNRYYVGLRNSVTGIGLGAQDAGGPYGSASRLQGVIQFPIDGFFDFGEQAAIHEMGHRWCCFLNLPALTPGRPHWPIGDIAYGIMGFSLPGGAGGAFPYQLTALPNGDYRADTVAAASEYNDLELHLMGLLPATEVGEHFAFQNQNQSQPIGGVFQGPVTRFNINDVIASAGVRVPAYGDAPASFRMGAIVLSRNRLMNADEMAFFEQMAARGEATTELLAASGAVRKVSKPFYLATRGKAKLSTVVCPDCPGGATSVSSASFTRGAALAPESIVSTFGFGFTENIVAATLPLPATLDETSVTVTDSSTAVRSSSLFFVSPGQINFFLPQGTAVGNATVNVVRRGQTIATGQVRIEAVAPALFTANANGQGVPAANVIRVVHPQQGDAIATYESPFQCGTAYGSCVPKPIGLGPANNEVFLELYGTGIRGFSSLGAVTCKIGGVDAEVRWAGLNQYFAGLDQVDVLIPRSLAGRGEAALALTVDGKPANTVTVNIQ